MSAEMPKSGPAVTSLTTSKPNQGQRKTPSKDHFMTSSSVGNDNKVLCQDRQADDSGRDHPSHSPRLDKDSIQRTQHLGESRDLNRTEAVQCVTPLGCPQQRPSQKEQILQLQVAHLQRILQEQNTLLSLIGPDYTFPARDCTVQRNLPPVTEESSESVDSEHCPESPFGMRGKLAINPEDRPIRPAVQGKQKTFEDFIEEQLKIDRDVLQKETQVRGDVVQSAERRSFLRKGEGTSRIKRAKNGALAIRASPSEQAKRINFTPHPKCPSPLRLQLGDPTGELRTASSSKQGGCPAPSDSTGEKTAEGTKFDQSSTGHGTLAPKEEIQIEITENSMQACCASGSQRRSASSTVTAAQNGDLAHHSDGGAIVVTGRKDGFTVTPQEERARFRKVNDHIVRACERKRPPSDKICRQSQIGPGCPNEGNLTAERVQCPPRSISSNSAGIPDNPRFHCYERPMPPSPSRLGHKDHRLDLSDDDYASDGPSETKEDFHSGTRASLKLRGRLSSSTSSSEDSDSELSSMRFLTRDSVKTLAKRQVQPGNTETAQSKSHLKNPSTSELLSNIFPEAVCTVGEESNNKHLTKEFLPEDSSLGFKELKKDQRDDTREMKRERESHQFMMEKMKTEQGKALEFLRQELDRFSLNVRDDITCCVSRRRHDRKNFSEAQNLRQQVMALQEQFEEREHHWSGIQRLLQTQIDALTRENVDLLIRLSAHERASLQTAPSAPSQEGAEGPVDPVTMTTSAAAPRHHDNVSSSTRYFKSQREDGQRTADDTFLALRARPPTPAFRKPPVHRRPGPQEEDIAHGNVRSRTQTKRELPGHLMKGKISSCALARFRHPPHSPEGFDVNSHSDCGQRIWCSESPEDRQVRLNRSCSSTPIGRQTPACPTAPSSPVTEGRGVNLVTGACDQSPRSVKAEVREEICYPDGKTERLLSNGSRVVIFRNGTRKEIGADQKSVKITFFNGDVKRILADGTLVYYYSDAQTTHTTYPSGVDILEFPNKQKEKHHLSGLREIFFPDGTVKSLYPDGHEESVFPDGTVVKLSANGEKTVEFTNGQREIHNSQYRRRIYPDGTVKTVYSNGRQETKYSSGRVRIKNNEGIVILDKK